MQMTIKDSNYRIIGYIDISSNGDKVVKNSSYRIIGYYDRHSDTTKDASYRILFYGDMAAALLVL